MCPRRGEARVSPALPLAASRGLSASVWTHRVDQQVDWVTGPRANHSPLLSAGGVALTALSQSCSSPLSPLNSVFPSHLEPLINFQH